jgi:hypothetical protein
MAANLPLRDAEAVKFCPVYDQYQAEITKIGDTRFALIKEYATNYSTLTDTQAHDLVTRMTGVDESLVQLRQKYIPTVAKVLPGKKTGDVFPDGQEGCAGDRSSAGVDDPDGATVGDKRNSSGLWLRVGYLVHSGPLGWIRLRAQT